MGAVEVERRHNYFKVKAGHALKDTLECPADYNNPGNKIGGRGRAQALMSAYLRMARDTFCFQGLSLRMPMPNPERKNNSPVVTRSHFCEASNSSTAESQIKAWSLLYVGTQTFTFRYN